MKGQWSVDSVDPVGGNKGVIMKMLTSMLLIILLQSSFGLKYFVAGISFHKSTY